MGKSKEKPKSSVPSKRWNAFEVSGDSVKKNKKDCPNCGKGIYLAYHEKPQKRYYCGKCQYVEYISE